MDADDKPLLTPKGRRSRELILRAAAERFEAEGFERTTIRGVAGAVDLDPAMILRYFGTKERLFLEATSIDLEIPPIDAVPQSEVGHALARHAVALWASETPGRALRILLRASAHDADAAARIRAVFAAQVLPLLPEQHPESALRAGLMTSQILGYAFGRYVIGLSPLMDATDDDVTRRLGLTLQSALDAP